MNSIITMQEYGKRPGLPLRNGVRAIFISPIVPMGWLLLLIPFVNSIIKKIPITWWMCLK